MNALEPLDTCRWCKKPIGLFPAGTATTCAHRRTRRVPLPRPVTGLCLTTYAIPTTRQAEPSAAPASNRYPSLRRSLLALLPARLRRRRPGREYSLRRLHAALGVPAPG